jgi:hypothetical protein
MWGLTDPMVAATGSLGDFSFADVPIGMYVITVNSKRFAFGVPSRTVNASDA